MWNISMDYSTVRTIRIFLSQIYWSNPERLKIFITNQPLQFQNVQYFSEQFSLRHEHGWLIAYSVRSSDLEAAIPRPPLHRPATVPSPSRRSAERGTEMRYHEVRTLYSAFLGRSFKNLFTGKVVQGHRLRRIA